MEEPSGPKMESYPHEDELQPEETQPHKRRKGTIEKTVVSVKISDGDHENANNNGKVVVKNEGPPSDSWSWRKYGQKPIKGSPYPRGYYRCSTSKGCSAKKQVERCKTDASIFIITYTSTHNHPDLGPGPDSDISTSNPTQQPPSNHHQHEDQVVLDKNANDHQEYHFHYLEEISNNDNDIIAINQLVEEEEEEEEEDHHSSTIMDLELKPVLLDEEPLISYSHLHVDLSSTTTTTTSSTINIGTDQVKLEEENDFFDELEELPTPPSLTSFMWPACFFDERFFHVIAPS